MVNGGACQGKTETVCEALACFEDEWLGLYERPPARSRAPWTTTSRRLRPDPGQGHPDLRLPADPGLLRRGLQGHDAGGLLRTVKQAIGDHGTKALAIDDITRLKLHREADQDVLDLIRELMSLPVTLILIGVGIPKSGLLRDGRETPPPASGCSPR
jgi:hypothetical protein